MVFAWTVPAAISLLVHFTAEACHERTLPATKGAHGAAEICAKGNMTTSTAHVQPGTNVTLSCQLSPQPQQCRIAIFFNSSELNSSYSSSVSTTFPVRAWGKHVFTCKRVCEYKKKLICGIEIQSGIPPDEPRNVSCVQYGTDGRPTCSWDKGRSTYINTTYLVQLSNGTDVFCASEEGLNEKVGSLALSKLSFDSTYTVVVAASNELGSASSQPLVFTLLDIVKPHPPNFSVEFGNSSVANCTFFWHDGARAQHCRLRYRPLTRHSWSMVESLRAERYSLDGLEPHTAYEFQGSCKIHPERGLWSNWSTFQARTPEAAPTGLLDLWYRQQDVDTQRVNISLFWKALSRSEAGGRILHYRVTLEALAPRSPPAVQGHLTTHTSYTSTVPRVGYKITLTAENSQGTSPPASIVTRLGTQDLPPPQNVSAIPLGNSSILISWKPPSRSMVPISGYVVEWAKTGRDPRLEHQPAWVKLPASNLSTVIAEHIEDNTCYQITVLTLYQDRAGRAAAVRGHSRAEAPTAGPQMCTAARANGVVVSWEAIPAQQQRGCLTAYRVYLQRKDGQGAPAVYSISNVSGPRLLHIPNLQPGELYTLWMTASTPAGEGPGGNSELLCLEGAGDWVTVVLTCSFLILSACICSVPPVRKASRSLLSVLVPQWQGKAIPDPANATWAKNYFSMKAELCSPSSLFLPDTSGFEEPETTQVEEETFQKTEPPGLGDKLPSCSPSRRGSGGEGPEAPTDQHRGGTGQEDVYNQQLPDSYKKMEVEVGEQVETPPEYLADLLTTGLPPPPELHPELEPLSAFPTTFLAPITPPGGNLTLDKVKISCSSSPR